MDEIRYKLLARHVNRSGVVVSSATWTSILFFLIPRAISRILVLKQASFTLYKHLGTRGPGSTSTSTPTPEQQKRHREAALSGKPRLARRHRERGVWKYLHLVPQRGSRERTRDPEKVQKGVGRELKTKRKLRERVRVHSQGQSIPPRVCT